MIYTIKNILLTLTLFFACFSGQGSVASEDLPFAALPLVAEETLSSIDEGALYTSPGLLQAEEQVRLLQPRPTLPHKPASGGDQAAALALELRLQLEAAGYLQRAAQISPGLSGCDIIFPFHYFW